MPINLKELSDKLEEFGIDYLMDYEQFEGTDLYPLARNYTEAKEKLVAWVEDNLPHSLLG